MPEDALVAGTNAELPRVLTADQAATLLQLTPNTVRTLAAQGEIPGWKIGKEWRFRSDVLMAQMAGPQEQPLPE